MGTEAIESLTRDQAGLLYDALPLPRRPATLNPRYVEVDARREPALQPVYLAYRAHDQRWLHSVHLTQIEGALRKDASSPYGYGGPLSSTDDPAFLTAAWNAYIAWMRDQHVVVEYVRFHPVLGNDRHYGGHVVDNRAVICVDLSLGDIRASYAPRLRQTLKKAAAAGLVYDEFPLGPHAREFRAYHGAAMRQMKADPFYCFADDYYERLAATGLARLGICRNDASAEAPWLAAALFLDGCGMREYHLAAISDEGRRVGASSFVLHEGALAARRRGMRTLYLGGGTDASAHNPLLFFKSAYSSQRLTYRTGWTVFDAAAYDELKERFSSQWAAHPERPIFYRIV